MNIGRTTTAGIAATVLLTLAACSAVPKLDAAGEPVINPQTGEPETEFVPDVEAIEKAAVALPPPWNLIVAAGAGVFALTRPKRKRNES